jgi:uncharacterized membrane protein (DUF485 family)
VDEQNGREAGVAPPPDPWADALATGWGDGGDTEWAPPAQPLPERRRRDGRDGAAAESDICPTVQSSPEFQRIRRQFRRFVVPAAIVFLGWYLAYVIAAFAWPGLMGRPVAGVVNVAMLAGLGQFATTFLLTWAYARHARLRREHTARELRWAATMRTRQESNSPE